MARSRPTESVDRDGAGPEDTEQDEKAARFVAAHWPHD
jgi:hypothetical protein